MCVFLYCHFAIFFRPSKLETRRENARSRIRYTADGQKIKGRGTIVGVLKSRTTSINLSILTVCFVCVINWQWASFFEPVHPFVISSVCYNNWDGWLVEGACPPPPPLPPIHKKIHCWLIKYKVPRLPPDLKETVYFLRNSKGGNLQ